MKRLLSIFLLTVSIQLYSQEWYYLDKAPGITFVTDFDNGIGSGYKCWSNNWTSNVDCEVYSYEKKFRIKRKVNSSGGERFYGTPMYVAANPVRQTILTIRNVNDYQYGLEITYDGGITWHRVSTLGYGFEIKCFSNNECYYLERDKLVLIKDGKKRLLSDLGNGYEEKAFYGAFALNEDSSFHLIQYDSTKVYAAKSTDYGKTWAKFRIDTILDNSNFPYINFIDPANGIILPGYSNDVLITEDSGRTWKKIESNLSDGLAISERKIINDGKNYYVGIQQFWISEDKGHTWKTMPLPTQGYVKTFECDKNGFCYIVDNLGNIFLNQETAETQIIKNKDDLTMFPNPVKDVLNIRVPYATDIIESRIYSLEGKYLFGAMNKFALDVSSLQEGMYILEVTTTGEVFTKRFVKE